jgi:carboxyl-terminal processing protease
MLARTLRIVTLVTLPLLTLVLGWHLGTEYEDRQLRQTRQQWEMLFMEQTGSGQLVSDPEREVNIELLWGVWRMMLRHYINPAELKSTPMLYGAIQGLVRAVGDPYSAFMTPAETAEFRESLQGHLEGIGAELTFKNDAVVVVAPLKASPAERAGLMSGDIIIEVDGEDVVDRSLSEVVKRIRGPKGTTVVLTVVRGNGDPLTFSIVREEVVVPSVESKVLKLSTGSIAYIALNQFGDDTSAEIARAVREVTKQPVKGVILDLRNNGGGYLEKAVDVVSLFVTEGKVVAVEHREGVTDPSYVRGRALVPDLPLVVLINQGSASASEIVAGALQDLGRATIIGMTSFGKGTVQEVLDLPGGSSLRVTTARWLTPKGKNLGKEGVKPDIVVDRTAEDVKAGKDPQLEAAERWLLSKQ